MWGPVEEDSGRKREREGRGTVVGKEGALDCEGGPELVWRRDCGGEVRSTTRIGDTHKTRGLSISGGQSTAFGDCSLTLPAVRWSSCILAGSTSGNLAPEGGGRGAH